MVEGTSVADGDPDLDREWWKESVVYQVYPRSFADSDGDGVGDLRGILDRLDYIADLGVDVVWLNPAYASPQVDAGYDISDYRAIHDEYGTMADWKALRDGLHERDVRLVMDLVVNHTSDEHEWFERSRDPDSPYHDWYHWAEGEPDEPPNNWTSGFGGSAWTYDGAVGKWYLHLFDEKQPDLNWRNPDVREAVFDTMNWWFDRGIDGFRMDVINLISKPEGYPDGDPDEDWVGIEHFTEGPRIHEYLREMDERVLAGRDAFAVGECIAVDPGEADRYAEHGLEMAINFDHVTLDFDEEAGWWEVREFPLAELKEAFGRWQTEPERAWPAVYLGNHDQPRMVSRFGDDGVYREEGAKLLATLLLTLRGTPFVFQGDEVGMTNYPWESLEELEDADAVNRVREAVAAGDVEGFEEVRELVRSRCRDNARTPMQWDDSANAGFTDPEADPWLPVNPNSREVNVAAARSTSDSIWHYYRELIALRHEHDVLVHGDYEPVLPDHESVWAYERTLGDDRAFVALNWSPEPTSVRLPRGTRSDRATSVASNYPDRTGGVPERLDLEPYEARVWVESWPAPGGDG
jgi:glycosidase